MKKQIALALCCFLAFSLVACGEQRDESTDSTIDPSSASSSSSSSSSSSNADTEDFVLDSRLIEVEGLAQNMYPNLTRMDELDTFYYGSVDVDIVFGKTLPGWEAVAAAYEKIQPGVVINLNSNYSSSTYKDKVTNAANDSNTDWDIFQGNLLSNPSSAAIDLSSTLTSENHYAGITDDEEAVGESKYWEDVLSEDAYITDKSMANTKCYIMNSESLSTAWFVNKTAFNDAVAQGYLNADGEADMPVTWDDLINLCAKLKAAGYSNPLAMAGDSASVNESQFAWLFRIYGDQYYRDTYPSINVQEGDKAWAASDLTFDFSLNDPQPESKLAYNPSLTRFWNSILDENNEYNEGKNVTYVGAMSDKFACFIENMYKLSEYLPADFTTTSFETQRDNFLSYKGKSSPVILLDYTGFGLTFGTEDRGFEVDFFDYPYMTCSHDVETKHVTTDFVRDVGGNGGYLSVMNHKNNSEQNEMNIDFLKFFMSPYGQSIYYRALQASKIAPDGLSTVQDFAVPSSWSQFFGSNKISFNGLCDLNWYNNNFIYHVNGQEDSRTAHLNVVQKLYKTSKQTTAEARILEFQTDWNTAVLTGFNTLCSDMNWSTTMWQKPGNKV